MSESETYGLPMIDGKISARGWEEASEVFLAGLWVRVQRDGSSDAEHDADYERFRQAMTIAAEARGDTEGEIMSQTLLIARNFMA